MSTSASPTSSRRLRSATCTTPSAASACEPVASFAARDAEEDHARDAEPGELAHLFAQALLRVLHDARHRHDRLGRVDAFLHEERRDEIVDPKPVLGDEPPQRRRAAQPAQPPFGKAPCRRCYLGELERPEPFEQRRVDEAVDGVRVGLDVDAQAPLAGGRRRDRADRDDERLRVGQRADDVAEVRDGRRRRERDRVDVAGPHPREVVGVGRGGDRAVHRRARRPCSPVARALRASTSRATSARASSTRAPGAGGAGTRRAATRRRSARARGRRAIPRRASAAAVPGPIAATRTGASARASSPAGARPRSKNASTPLADVNTSHSYRARSGTAKSTGSSAIAGSSMTSAPSCSSSVRSSLACSRARVTTMRRPNSGRCSNHAKSSAATSPTTIADGASTPTRRDRRERRARSCVAPGRVPHRTAATGCLRRATAVDRARRRCRRGGPRP